MTLIIFIFELETIIVYIYFKHLAFPKIIKSFWFRHFVTAIFPFVCCFVEEDYTYHLVDQSAD